MSGAEPPDGRLFDRIGVVLTDRTFCCTKGEEEDEREAREEARARTESRRAISLSLTISTGISGTGLTRLSRVPASSQGEADGEAVILGIGRPRVSVAVESTVRSAGNRGRVVEKSENAGLYLLLHTEISPLIRFAP